MKFISYPIIQKFYRIFAYVEDYLKQIKGELLIWQCKMQRPPNFRNRFAHKTQQKINSYIPEKVHKGITTAIKHMVKAVIQGSDYTKPKPLAKNMYLPIEVKELKAKARINIYSKTAATEGAVTGAGGILMSFADFPLFLSIKMKMLFDIAYFYGFNTEDYKERIYLLHIFQLAFSSQQHRNKIYKIIESWETYAKNLSDDINQFDWRSFQQEYRDYIDLAKLLQMVPGIGMVVGGYVNHTMSNKLGQTAMNAYRMKLDV